MKQNMQPMLNAVTLNYFNGKRNRCWVNFKWCIYGGKALWTAKISLDKAIFTLVTKIHVLWTPWIKSYIRTPWYYLDKNHSSSNKLWTDNMPKLWMVWIFLLRSMNRLGINNMMAEPINTLTWNTVESIQ